MENFINKISHSQWHTQWYYGDYRKRLSEAPTEIDSENFMLIEGSPNDEDGQKRDIYLNIDNLSMIHKEGRRIIFTFKDGSTTCNSEDYIRTDLQPLNKFFRKKVVTVTFETSETL